MYMMPRYCEKMMLPLTYARMPSVSTMIALVPVARPSTPSVMLAPLLTAVMMKMTTAM